MQWPPQHRVLMTLIMLYLTFPETATGQMSPGLGYVFPPAIPVGTATDVQLGGFDFTDDLQWFVHSEYVRLQVLGLPGDYHLPPPPYWIGPRAATIALPIPREVSAQLEVDGQAPAGLVRWQVANANGVSDTAVFYLSRGPEIIESRSRDFSQRLPSLPVAVSGRLARLTEIDRYEIVAEQDGPISVDLMARRLGSDFHGILQVHNATGDLLADFADTEGLDGGLTFPASAGATYRISLHDLDFRGDRAYVYRLAVEPGPRVSCTIPAFGQRGTTRDVEFIGVGIATGQPVTESIRQVVNFPSDANLAAWTHSVQTNYGLVQVTIPLSDLTEEVKRSATLENPDEVLALNAPAAITSPLPGQHNQHRYSWPVKKDEHWSVEVQSRAVGGCLDMALTLLGPDGKQIADNDDLPGTSDAGAAFRAAEDGTWTCIVRSLSQRIGAPGEIYRLQLKKLTPDFTIEVPPKLSVLLGGKTEVTVKVARIAGFDGDITIRSEGLSEGLTMEGDGIIPAGKNELKAVFLAAPDAAVVASTIQFHGSARIGEADVTRRATASAAGNRCPRTPSENQTSAVLLAVTMPAPFDVLVVDRERQRDVPRGTTCLVDLDIVRKEGFEGEVQVVMSAQQSRNRQGIRGTSVRVSPGVTRIQYPCFMPEWLATDLTRRIVVHGVATIPDPKGVSRQLTKAGDARITMILEGALLKISCDAEEQSVPVGGVVSVPVTISRSVKLPVATIVELMIPEEIQGLLKADPLLLEPGQNEGTLQITSMPDDRLQGPWKLRLTATSLQDAQWPVVSETEVAVKFTRPDVSGPP